MLTLGTGFSVHIGASPRPSSASSPDRISALPWIALRGAKTNNPSVRRTTAIAISILGAVVALLVLDVVAWPYRPDASVPRSLLPFIAVAVLVPACIGALIVARRPRNVVAWLMLVGALTVTPIAPVVPSHAWALQWDRASWPALYAWPVAVAYIFPSGRLLNRRWRPVALGAAVCFVAFTAIAMLDASSFDPPNRDVRSPLAGVQVPGYIAWIWVPIWLGILASLFVGAYAVRLRLRRSTGIERLQTLWLAWAASLIPLGLVLCGLGWPITWWFGPGVNDKLGAAVYPFLLVMEAAVAAAVGIAVFRYRLYAIDVLINRTLVYGGVTIVLAAAYAVITVVFGITVGRGSAWLTAAATLAVAAAFRPVRARVQDSVDRRFDRQRYAGIELVEAFEGDVREGRRPPEEIGAVVAQALGDPLAELLFWLPASEVYADAHGQIHSIPRDGRVASQIEREGDRVGVVLHDGRLSEQPRLVGGILTAAALSAEIARLRVEVRIQLQEVEASRARIVEAGYEERRRLERDLHDGAQQRLVSLGLELRRMQRTLPAEATVLAPALDRVVNEIGSAIRDLRQIAAGVRPTRLDDGLAAALHDLARTAPLPVEVDARIDRVAASVEAAAFFVACEAVTNAVKHAAASKVAVRATRENGSLVLTIADDGVGGATARRGSGLAGLQDRVSALRGELRITSPDGGGTRVDVVIPCAS